MLAGEEHLSHEQRHYRWINDAFNDLNHDDALWAFTIRDSEIFARADWESINDSTLHRLMRMGIYDWVAPDEELHQATRAIRYSSAISSRLLARILAEETRVRLISVSRV
jgi:hypothetical protein